MVDQHTEQMDDKQRNKIPGISWEKPLPSQDRADYLDSVKESPSRPRRLQKFSNLRSHNEDCYMPIGTREQHHLSMSSGTPPTAGANLTSAVLLAKHFLSKRSEGSYAKFSRMQVPRVNENNEPVDGSIKGVKQTGSKPNGLNNESSEKIQPSVLMDCRQGVSKSKRETSFDVSNGVSCGSEKLFVRDVALFKSQIEGLKKHIDLLSNFQKKESHELSDVKDQLNDLSKKYEMLKFEKAEDLKLWKKLVDVDDKLDHLEQAVYTNLLCNDINKRMCQTITHLESDGCENSKDLRFCPIEDDCTSENSIFPHPSRKYTKSSMNYLEPTKYHSNDDSESRPSEEESTDSSWIPVAPDFDRFISSISSLNLKMDRHQSMKMTRTDNGNGATFKNADTLNLELYKNGLVVGESGFRTYSRLSIIRFINEIYSGCFPSELHPQFPDGVIFIVVDNRGSDYSTSTTFSGPGRKLTEGCTRVMQITPLKPDDLIFRKAMGSASFPGETRSCSSCSETEEKESCAIKTIHDLCTKPDVFLKLKDIGSGQVFKVGVRSDETKISHLIDALKKVLQVKDLILILPRPYGSLSSLSSTLKDYGIAGNSLLYYQVNL